MSRQLGRAVAAGAMLAALAAPLAAQSVSDFRLQPGTATSAPRPAGPSDPDSPAPVRTAPTATPPPITLPSPAATAPPPRTAPGAAPAARPSQPTATTPAETRLPRVLRTEPEAPAAGPRANTAAPEPRPTAAQPAPPVPAAVAPPEPAPAMPPATSAPAPAAPVPVAEPTGSSLPWLLAAALLLAALGGAALFLRRRTGALAVPEPEELATEALPEPTPYPLAEPQVPAPAPMSTPPAAPLPAAASPFDIALHPTRLSVSLVNATLHYELAVTNRAGTALGPVFVAADMIGAHASIPEDSQLARDGSGLELRHEIPALAPGETVRVKGDLRLPLSAVTPIRSGTATLLVPLVRVRAEAPGLSATRVLVVGEPSATQDGRLRPFRLDAGPRIFGSVSQREVAAAA